MTARGVFETARGVLETFGTFFYIVNPAKHTFETVEEVPNYINEAIPLMLVCFYFEQLFLWLKRRKPFPLSDTMGNAHQGTLYIMSKVFFRGWYTVAFLYVYNNWRIIDLPLNSPWTWWIGLIGTDFLFYWGHRLTHDVNFLWAIHQVHHSSEEYNLSTGTRLHALQELYLSFFYLPLCLVVHPAVVLAHTEFNLLYQFWIHTEVIPSIGWIEYVFNSPSHHRVHHGRNRSCIDKNFGSVLIIWDRIFGTFEPEKDKKIVYGLTTSVNSFEVLYLQGVHFWNVYKTFREMPGLKNKLSVIFKGPGWTPGSPWHGRIEDIPEVKGSVEKYNPAVPLWFQLYSYLHGSLLTLVFLIYEDLPFRTACPLSVFIILSLTILGRLLDGRSYAPRLELTRCLLFLLIDSFMFPLHTLLPIRFSYYSTAFTLFRALYIASVLAWTVEVMGKGSKGIVQVFIKLQTNKKVD